MASIPDKKILLGVTGGIAAYKSADLVRRLMEAGAEVQVVMTAGAQEFVTPLTFQALSGREVRTELFDRAAEAAMGHIELARWADLILVAPASADFLSRLTHGAADDLLTTLCLATDAPVAVAPAMNRMMWANAATQANVSLLRERGVYVWGPGEGDQACGEIGPGRMLEPLQLRDEVLALCGNDALGGQKVVVTAGPTREAIDPVRFITNHSSGRMGFALAEACATAGAEVTLVCGPVTLPTPAGVTRVDVKSAAEMHEQVMHAVGEAQIFIAAAAVADYRPTECAAHKIKKSDSGKALAMERTRDILADVAASHPRVFTLGFAAETANLKEHALDKLVRKGLSMIAANWVGPERGFQQEDNALHVFWEGGETELVQAPKKVLAQQLVELLVQRLAATPEQQQSA